MTYNSMFEWLDLWRKSIPGNICKKRKPLGRGIQGTIVAHRGTVGIQRRMCLGKNLTDKNHLWKASASKADNYDWGPSPRKPELFEAIPDLINKWIDTPIYRGHWTDVLFRSIYKTEYFRWFEKILQIRCCTKKLVVNKLSNRSALNF